MAEAKRRLAAILSADVAGYSRLMGADEQATLDSLNACREVFRTHIGYHHGRVVDTAGDSVLAVFDSVVEAVQCAVDVQTELNSRNAKLVEDQRMLFRIGVNAGDVIEQDDGTVYGDGVNIAARLQALAEPGGVCVSETAHLQAKGKLDATFEDRGEHAVKNITEPVRAYGVIRDASPTVSAPVPTKNLSDKPSIAVLPFDNLSGNPEQEYFADGIAEQIITELSRFRDLTVLARNSTFQYKGRSVDVRQIGQDLNCRYVLEGSVRRAGERIRVAAQLIDAADGAHLWAETYQRDLTAADLFDVQDDIAGKVVAMIGDSYGVLSRSRLEQRRRNRTDSIDAVEAVLRAHAYYQDDFTAERHERVRASLERAVEIDPDYADAWAWLAATYRDEYNHGFNPRPNPLVRAETATRKAIALEPENHEAHLVLAQVHMLNRDVEAFRAQADKTLALNPNSADKLASIAVYTFYAGDWEGGVAMAKKAVALTPSPPGWFILPLALDRYRRGQYAEALAEAQKINLPGIDRASTILAAIYGQLGREQEAKLALGKVVALNSRFKTDTRAELRRMYYSDELVELIIDGLKKAGMDIPDCTEI